MKKTIYLLLILALFVSCDNCVVDNYNKANDKQTPFIDLKQRLMDTIEKYSILEEALKIDDSLKCAFYINGINHRKIAIFALEDSVFCLFQRQQDKWVQIDSGQFISEATSFEVVNLNDDYYSDLIMYGRPSSNGVCEPFVFISDTTGVLHYRADIYLSNIEYDKNTKLVRSSYYGGSDFRKELYRWENDSLKLIKGVELIYSFGENEGKFLTFYNSKNGKRNEYKVVKDNDETIFMNALWKDN